ncbi:NACHT C-terminal alpha/beta 1 domain-containing protein [Microcoleus sp. A006_D1]
MPADSLNNYGTICLIAESPHPIILTFSPQNPHLSQNMIIWLQHTILET